MTRGELVQGKQHMGNDERSMIHQHAQQRSHAVQEDHDLHKSKCSYYIIRSKIPVLKLRRNSLVKIEENLTCI